MASTNWSALAAKAAEAPDAGNFEPLPDGKYEVSVEAVEVRPTKTGKQMFVITFLVAAGSSQGRKLWSNIVISPESPVALSIAFRHLAALGADASFFATEPDDSDLCARLISSRAIVTVGRRKDDASRNDVKDIATASDPLAPSAPAAAPAAAAAPTPPSDPF
jgi:hypothetical protein